jgi:hypothetical protein
MMKTLIWEALHIPSEDVENRKRVVRTMFENSRPQVIAFAGPVGVGKSTQIRLLAYKLRSKRLRVKTTFFLKGHLFSYFLQNILAKILCNSKNSNLSAMRILLDGNPGAFKKLFKLWLVTDTVSNCLKFLVSIYIPIKLGYIVLVEDYIPTTIVHYRYYCQVLKLPVSDINFSTKLMLKLFSYFLTWVIFLDSRTEALKYRWILRGSPYEKDDYIYFRRKILLCLLRIIIPSRLIYIRTDNCLPDEVNKLIMEGVKL